MKKSVVVELYEFSQIEGITDQALLREIKKSQYNFFRKQKGFIKCEILKCSNKWISIRYWNDIEEARKSVDLFPNHPSCFPFVQMVSPSSEQRLYFKRKFLSVKKGKSV